ncbi:hypothetical protein K9M78_02765 [Candidatus Bipolaricaulota bacterium]|nr:hypothetical protein [Candidatus Bipolaricaulota bacterium]
MWWKISVAVLSVVIVLGVTLIYMDKRLFNNKVEKEVQELFESAETGEAEVITEEDLSGLPEPVQRHLRYAGIIGRKKVKTVRLKQEGRFRQSEDGSWMSFEAEQYYTTDPPGFIWKTDMSFLPLVSVVGRDKYYRGEGNMLIKLPPFIKIADARGDDIDQGTLVRYLNEIMWFPTAYLSDYISWEPIDSTSARATMTDHGKTVSAVLHFDEAGRLVDFVADRYYTGGDEPTLETWTTPIKEYGAMEGLRLPIKGEGVWKLDSVDFTYIELEVTELEYGVPEVY